MFYCFNFSFGENINLSHVSESMFPAHQWALRIYLVESNRSNTMTAATKNAIYNRNFPHTRWMTGPWRGKIQAMKKVLWKKAQDIQSSQQSIKSIRNRNFFAKFPEIAYNAEATQMSSFWKLSQCDTEPLDKIFNTLVFLLRIFSIRIFHFIFLLIHYNVWLGLTIKSLLALL